MRRRRELKRVLRQHPDFAAWLKQDMKRIQEIRSNPAEVDRLLNKWKQSLNRRNLGTALDFEEISRKTKRASEVLNKVQSIMESMAEQAKEEQTTQRKR